ncbi:MAG: carboxypeptidase regulatory-like domain-containing protein [Planctomycetes bacterium]|nr:carboxypeptidase regulatory-like domain-containing protein [Planctomycetota bacterium]
MLDSRGLAVADVPLGLVPFDPTSGELRADADACTTRSDALGQFELATVPPASVPAAGPGWFTLRTTPWHAGHGGTTDLVVVVARATELVGGTTRRDDGTPLAGVAVQADLLRLAEFPDKLTQTFAPLPAPARSDERGSYRLAHAPVGAGVDLVFSRDGFQPERVPSLAAASGRLDVSMVAKGAGAAHLHGRVRDAEGPVVGATLQLGFDQQTTSDGNGEFTFEPPEAPSRLVALRAGWQPLIREQVGAGSGELDLVFERATLSITGTVRHADGTPASGYRLDLVDPTRGYGFHPIEFDSQTLKCSEPCFAITDAAGRFEVGGLADRTYTLLAYEPDRLVVVRSERVPAGSRDVVLTVPADATFELRGVVVDRRGAPIANASVSCWLAAASVEGAVGGPATTSAADGTFTLANAPRRGVRLGIAKEGWLYANQLVEQWTRDGDELRVVLTRMCSLRVEGAADLVVQFHDADGSLLHVELHSQTMISSTNALTLPNGKSPVLSLPETTATMVWKRGGEEVGRKAVFLDPAPDAVTLLIADV